MAKSNQPFCMELVTIDTHTPDGYICDECKHEYDSQYANVISCQSRQVEAFVRWCQKQEWIWKYKQLLLRVIIKVCLKNSLST